MSDNRYRYDIQYPGQTPGKREKRSVRFPEEAAFNVPQHEGDYVDLFALDRESYVLRNPDDGTLVHQLFIVKRVINIGVAARQNLILIREEIQTESRDGPAQKRIGWSTLEVTPVSPLSSEFGKSGE